MQNTGEESHSGQVAITIKMAITTMKKLTLLSMITFLSFVLANPVTLNNTESTVDSSDITISDLIENQPKISASTINLLKPAIDDWLQFYELNIEDFHSAQFDHSIMLDDMIVYKGEFDYEYDPL